MPTSSAKKTPDQLRSLGLSVNQIILFNSDLMLGLLKPNSHRKAERWFTVEEKEKKGFYTEEKGTRENKTDRR